MIEQRMKWDQLLHRKFGSTGHFRLLNQVRSDLKSHTSSNQKSNVVQNTSKTSLPSASQKLFSTSNSNDSIDNTHLKRALDKEQVIPNRNNEEDFKYKIDEKNKSKEVIDNQREQSISRQINQIDSNTDTDTSNNSNGNFNINRDEQYSSNYKIKTEFRKAFRDRLNTIDLR